MLHFLDPVDSTAYDSHQPTAPGTRSQSTGKVRALAVVCLLVGGILGVIFTNMVVNPGFVGFLFFLVLGPCVLALYLVPAFVAAGRDHPHFTGIILLNILSGWMWGLGWLAALIWAVTTPAVTAGPSSRELTSTRPPAPPPAIPPADPDPIARIAQLHQLLQAGALTRQEFDEQKARLLRVQSQQGCMSQGGTLEIGEGQQPRQAAMDEDEAFRARVARVQGHHPPP